MSLSSLSSKSIFFLLRGVDSLDFEGDNSFDLSRGDFGRLDGETSFGGLSRGVRGDFVFDRGVRGGESEDVAKLLSITESFSSEFLVASTRVSIFGTFEDSLLEASEDFPRGE